MKVIYVFPIFETEKIGQATEIMLRQGSSQNFFLAHPGFSICCSFMQNMFWVGWGGVLVQNSLGYCKCNYCKTVTSSY